MMTKKQAGKLRIEKDYSKYPSGKSGVLKNNMPIYKSHP